MSRYMCEQCGDDWSSAGTCELCGQTLVKVGEEHTEEETLFDEEEYN